MSIISATFQINGKPVPVNRYNVEGGSVGSAGSMMALTSLIALERSGVDLVQQAIQNPSGLPIDLFVTVDEGPGVHLFSGEYVNSIYAYGDSSVTIHSRDWSGPLQDQKRVLVSLIGGQSGALTVGESDTSQGVSTQNQKVSQLVTSIAQQFDLIADIRLSGDDPTIGQVFGNTTDTVYSPQPQPLWAILLKLAKETGNIVYVSPEKHLVFGSPGAGLSPLLFTWKANPVPAGSLPLMDLDIDHNPRRNLTFQVIVNSFDPTLGQITKGQAYVVGTNISTDGGSTVQAGMWTGSDAQNVANAVGTGSASGKNKIPIYTFHVDGLTTGQAQQRAQSIAADIAKRELIVRAEAGFVPLTAPSTPARLDGAIDPEFLSHNYFVTGYTHTLRMKKGKAEFSTHMKMFDVQPAGQGEAVSEAE